MTTLAERLNSAAQRLAAATATPRLDAQILLAHALGINRAQLMARLKEAVSVPEYDALVARRSAHEPLAYILGEWEFFSMRFSCKKPVFVPRPETEHLVEAVLEEADGKPARILDVGTGTGCVGIAVAAHNPHCRVTAVDIRADAVRLAALNARLRGVEGRFCVLRADLLTSFSRGEHFDIVCSNPPYVEEGAWQDLSPAIRLYETPMALLSGTDGMDCIRRLANDARRILKTGGLLALEIGQGQADGVRDILRKKDYTDIWFRKDLAGIDRVATARKSAC